MTAALVALGELTKIRTGKLDANAANENGAYPFFTCAVESLSINTAAFDCKAVLVAGNGDLNVKYYEGKFNAYQRTYVIESLDECKLLPKYLYLFLDKYVGKLREQAIGGVIKYIKMGNLTEAKIPLPSLAQQQRIAAILDKAAEIKAKREQAIAKLDNLVASAFEECCSKSAKQTVEKIKNLVIKQKLVDRGDGNVWSLALDQVESNSGQVLSQVIVSKGKLGTSTYYFEPDVVLYSKLRPYLNKVVIPETYGYATTELVPLYCNKEKILPVFMAAYLRSSKFVNFANTNSAGAKMPRVMMDKFWDYEMTLPDLGVQRDFQQLSEKCNAMKQSLKDCIDKQEQLIASLQHQAFTTGFAA